MGFKLLVDLNSLTNTQKQQTVTPDSFTVDDNSALASTDMYVDILLQTNGLNASLVAHNQAYSVPSYDSSLLQSAAGKLWFVAAKMPVGETSDTVTVKHDATPDGVALRAVLLRDRKIVGENNAYVKLVCDNAGAGNTHFTTAGGLDWLVEDVDATTQPGWAIGIAEINDTLVINATDAFPSDTDFYIIEPNTGNVIPLLSSSGVVKEVFIDVADAEADRLNANFTNTSDHSVEVADYTDVTQGAQIVPIYVNPTAGTQSRLQHAFPFVTDTIYIPSTTTNQVIPIVYNASAAADGYRLRLISADPFATFAYNNTSTGTDTDTAFYTSTDLTRFQNVKAA